MAIENAIKFLEQISADETLRTRTTEKTADDVIAVAKELGFDLTQEEITAAAKTLLRDYQREAKELPVEELESVSGGKPYIAEGVINFISWIACGFNHNYEYTGKTQWRIDLFWHVTFYQRICRDCGHEDWTRDPPIQGPQIGEKAY